MRRTYLHFQYDDDKATIHLYYFGSYIALCNQLTELMSDADGHMNIEFQFQSKPFDRIDSRQYVELKDEPNGIN